MEEEEIKTWRVPMFRKLRDRPGMTGELPELLAGAGKDRLEDSVNALVDHGNPVDWPTGKHLMQSWHLQLPMECPHALEDVAGYGPSDDEAQPDGDVWPAAVARVIMTRGWERTFRSVTVRRVAALAGPTEGAVRRGHVQTLREPAPHLSSGWTSGLSRPWDSGAQGSNWNAGMFSAPSRAGRRIRKSPRSPTHARGSAPSRRPALWMVAAITAPGSKPTVCLGAFR